MDQDIHFCRTQDDVRLAYAIAGKGQPIVRAAHWLTHLQYDITSPVFGPWIREFSQGSQYIRYDERGSGLSDWNPDIFTFDAWVRDLGTLVDHIGLKKFDLLGVSQGGPVGIAYAVKHPERVSHLVLIGAFGRGWSKRQLTSDEILARSAARTLMGINWDQENPAARQIFTSHFIPGGTIEQFDDFNRLQRFSTSARNAVQFWDIMGDIDVRDLLPKVSVPTLILHAKNDAAIPFDWGRELASMIPNSKFVPLEGKNHVLLEQEPAWKKFLSEVRGFLGIKEPPEEAGPRAKELGLPGWLKGPRK